MEIRLIPQPNRRHVLGLSSDFNWFIGSERWLRFSFMCVRDLLPQNVHCKRVVYLWVVQILWFVSSFHGIFIGSDVLRIIPVFQIRFFFFFSLKKINTILQCTMSSVAASPRMVKKKRKENSSDVSCVLTFPPLISSYFVTWCVD